MNQCTHQKECFYLEKGQIVRSCIDCAGQHTSVVLRELDLFLEENEKYNNEYWRIVYCEIPTMIEQLKLKLEQLYSRLQLKQDQQIQFQQIREFNNQTTDEMNDEQLKSVVEYFLNKRLQKEIRLKIPQATQMFEQVSDWVQKLNPLGTKSCRLNTIEKYKLVKIRLTNQKQDQMIKENQCHSYNDEIIEQINHFEIPTKYQIKHIYSATILKEQYIGIALGEQHPFLIYNLFSKEIFDKIQLDKGIYDSIVVGDNQFVLGCFKTIQLYSFNDKIQLLPITFEQSKNSNPIKLCYCSQNNSILSTDYLTQLGQTGCINQWNLETGQLIKYILIGKTSGALCILNDGLHFMASITLTEQKKKKSQILIWEFGLEQVQKKLNVKETIFSLTQSKDSIIGFGSNIYLWNIKSYKFQKIQYPGRSLDPFGFLFYDNKYFIGDNDGNVQICSLDFSNWKQLIKMRSKIMKINQLNQFIIVCSYNSSFCVFKMKEM